MVQVVGNVQGVVFTTAKTVLIMMKVMPITIFFAGFLNYWTLCSLYALIRTQKPDFLTELLNSIYDAINISIFQALNIDISVDS